MVFKHLVFAGLCSAAALAQAGTLDSASLQNGPRPAWTFGNVPMPSAIDPVQPLVLAGPGTWTTYSRYGDRGGPTTTTLFSGFGPGLANLAAASAPATGSAFTNGPADTTQLGNGGVTGGPSAPPPFTDIAHGHEAESGDGAAITPPASDLINVVVTTPTEAPQLVLPQAPAAISEPATGMLVLAGILGAGLLGRRRRR